MPPPRIILVPTDFSLHADRALEYAAELAARLDARIHLLHVVTYPVLATAEMSTMYIATLMESLRRDAQLGLDERVQRYRDRVSLGPVRIEEGDPRDQIDRTAETIGADLIAMGTHGRRGIRRLLLGSVAESVVRTAPCPVLTIRLDKR